MSGRRGDVASLYSEPSAPIDGPAAENLVAPATDLPSAEESDGTIVRSVTTFVQFTASISGGILLAAATAMLVVRWRDITSSWGAAVAGLTLFAGVPLLVASVLGWVAGSKSLRIGAALISAVYVVTINPVNAVVGCSTTRADDELTILTTNILGSTYQPANVAAMIVDSGADVVILQEVTARVHEALRGDDTLTDYSYWSSADGAVNLRKGSSDVLVLSKLAPLSSEDVDLGSAGAADITFELPAVEARPNRLASVDGPRETISSAGTFTLTALHLNAPSRADFVEPWRNQLAALAGRPTDSPAILAGDFNATEDHRPFRHLLAQGWSDVHEGKGCGFGLTFPVDGSLPIPVMRLDHVLVTDHFEVLGVEMLDDSIGSDHRPVLTNVRLRTDRGW